MESSTRSRKRKQRPSESDPFAGIFTRSRSQIYFHRHRSGYARSDSNRIRNLIQKMKSTSQSTVKQQQSEVVALDQGSSQVSVIDLRARRVFSPATVADDVVSVGEVDMEDEVDVCKKNDGNGNLKFSIDEGVAVRSDLEVSGSVAVDMQARSENVVEASLISEKNVVVGDGFAVVQMTPTVADSEQNHKFGDKDEMILVADQIGDNKGLNKNQPLVTALRGRRKVFKSPTSFNYRRLLPYLMDSGNDDSSSIEIVEKTLSQNLKSNDPVTNMVPLKNVDIGSVSGSRKLADGLLNNAASSEKQILNSVNAGLNSVVERSDVMRKSQEGGLSDTLECEQMTPPDSNIFSKSKIDNVSSVLVKPTYKPVLKSCSRQKLLQTPTSFSHRRLLPFLMSVAEDYSSSVKDNQSIKLEKPVEQNQQPITQLLHQDGKSTAADETSNSPTSTLIPVDTSIDITKSVTLVSDENILDANGSDNVGSGLISQLEVNLQGEAVKSDSCIKMELSPPKSNLKCVEEAIINVATPLRIEQSFSEDQHVAVKESPTSKATPVCIEQSSSKDNRKIVKESPTSKPTPLRIEQSSNDNQQKTVKESPQHYSPQISATQGANIKCGILKRTPRGCRGICNCLNCTSFRLHAERSFEFSRNQMHDAEEVALELMNELSCLRNILETTSSRTNSLDNDNEKQVKEACAKALYKEQEARARLAQMNEDLSIHCRSMTLLRPKVTFANKIEEKVISKDQVYGKRSV